MFGSSSIRWIFVLVSVFGLGLGCGDGGSDGSGKAAGGSTGGCMVYDEAEAQVLCLEVPGPPEVMSSMECAPDPDTQTDEWLSEGCPTAGAFGYCVAGGPHPSTTYFYAAYPVPPQEVKENICEGTGGTWHAL